MLRKYNLAEVYQGRLETGDDLAVELSRIVEEESIKAGKVSAIGAVKQAVISYYDQEQEVYEKKKFEKEMEIVNLVGNISLKDGEPIVHAHIALADEEGRIYGGHLEEGTAVFACEFTIEEYKGEAWERGYHEETGLPLWKQD